MTEDYSHAPTTRAAIDKERIEELEAHNAALQESVRDSWRQRNEQKLRLEVHVRDEAALRAEVERLTRERDKYLEQIRHLEAEYASLRARITELEGALEKIAGDGGDDNAFSRWAVALARAALTSQETEGNRVKPGFDIEPIKPKGG